ncbi:cytochrome P450 [Streptomyces sp. NPDC004232]|uniref:cytochrome P450 n=1 Tax=unclassified Streptomyces TaxID=2593676 RepID=UPI001D2CAC5E|nr:cytochrome P450 [Streptomyces sp. tea 10]
MTRPVVDLTDPDRFVRQEHHAMLAWLRENDPVHWHETGQDGGFWALTGYEDISQVYLDHTDFSSESGPMLGGSFRSEKDPSAGLMMVATDLPRHRMIRQQLHWAFGQDMLRKVMEQVTRLVTAALERALADGGCDFATDVAPELPAGAVMAITGVSYEDAHELIGMTRRMIGFRDPHFADPAEDERLILAMTQADIFEFFAEVLRARRKNPGPDLISRLLKAEMNGRAWTEDEILYNCMNIAVGGNETSSYTACSGLEALIGHPEQYAELRHKPGLLDSAVNEILRWSSTNLYVRRGALRDVEVGGRTIRSGDVVTLWNASANRDAKQFTDPETFDLARTPNRHLSYGAGLHRCIGAMLAQTELSVVFRAIADLPVTAALSGPVQRLRSNFINGTTSLPVTFHDRNGTGGRPE